LGQGKDFRWEEPLAKEKATLMGRAMGQEKEEEWAVEMEQQKAWKKGSQWEKEWEPQTAAWWG
jgi:hypothetical protein